MSYLGTTFLDGYDGTDLSGPSVPNAPAPGEQAVIPAPAPRAMITLPGGITMPKATFYVILAIVAAVAFYLYMKRKKEQ